MKPVSGRAAEKEDAGAALPGDAGHVLHARAWAEDGQLPGVHLPLKSPGGILEGRDVQTQGLGLAPRRDRRTWWTSARRR